MCDGSSFNSIESMCACLCVLDISVSSLSKSLALNANDFAPTCLQLQLKLSID